MFAGSGALTTQFAPRTFSAVPRLGGFVIHGNSARTLDLCLESLVAVCDEVVAIDSQSSDGSRELCARRAVRSVVVPWRGFGASRAEARRHLSDHDYLFFLDSDEALDSEARESIRRWRAGNPTLPHYRLKRRDWAEIGGGRFLFRTETRVRLIRIDCATWDESWIVHEAMPPRESELLEGFIDHDFVQSVEALVRKQRQYALPRPGSVRPGAAGLRGGAALGHSDECRRSQLTRPTWSSTPRNGAERHRQGRAVSRRSRRLATLSRRRAVPRRQAPISRGSAKRRVQRGR